MAMRWDEIAKRVCCYARPKIAEVGVWRGKNAINLLRLIPHLDLTLVDPWSIATGPYSITGSIDSRTTQDEMDRIAASTIRAVGSRARVIRRRSVDAAALLARDRERFDLVFIDADHSYDGCREDIVAWLPLAASWLGGHDYRNARLAPDGLDRFPGVTRAVDEAFGERVTRGSDSTWWVNAP